MKIFGCGGVPTAEKPAGICTNSQKEGVAIWRITIFLEKNNGRFAEMEPANYRIKSKNVNI